MASILSTVAPSCFDSCINHNSPDFAKDLKANCSEGIDVYFENVGGKVFETVSPLLNDFARIMTQAEILLMIF